MTLGVAEVNTFGKIYLAYNNHKRQGILNYNGCNHIVGNIRKSELLPVDVSRKMIFDLNLWLMLRGGIDLRILMILAPLAIW